MSIQSYLLILFHLLPWSLCMGMAFYFAFIVRPIAKRLFKGEERLKFLRWNIKYYSPLFLLFMSLMVVSGAWRLTDYKIIFGIEYLQKIFTVLGLKLIIFLMAYLLAAYQSFSLGLRVTGQGDKAMEDPVTAELVEKNFNKMRWIAIINLFLMTAAAYVGLMLSRAPYLN